MKAEKKAPFKSWLHSDATARWLMPRLAGWPAWAETVLITLLAVFIGRLASPSDPFYLASQYPWPWLAPLLVALRYGALPGVVSSAILFAAWLAWAPGGLDADIPKLYFLGGLLSTMICGEYSGIWRTRVHRTTEINSYLEDRVERITKRLYLMRLSHDRLEQELLTRPVTLRDALTDLRRLIAGKTGTEPMPGAQEFLEFLSRYCQVEVASLYIVSQNGPDIRLGPQQGRLGEPPQLREDDPLYLNACDHGRLAHVQALSDAGHAPTKQLVVAPMLASDKKMIGVLAISNMPFFALNEDNLQTMQVLLSAYADGISSAKTVLPLLARHPGCPVSFATELVILQRIQRDFGIDSHIAVLIFDLGRDGADMYEHVLRQRRAPDIIWPVESLNGNNYIINQMPLTGRAAVEGYLVRTETSLKQTFGGNFADLGIRIHVLHLTETEPLESIQRLLASP